MKKNPTHSSLKWLFIFLLSICLTTSSAQTSYLCYFDNIVQVNPSTITFEIWIKNTGVDNINLAGFQAGIDINYGALANGGFITASFVSGPIGYNLINIDPSSKQIRITSPYFALHPPIPTSPGYLVGKYQLTNTTNFVVAPSFTWSFQTSTCNTTNTVVLCTINETPRPANGSRSPSNDGLSVNITNPASHINVGSSIPTLSEWGMIVFTVLIFGSSIFFLKNVTPFS
jgi:hypothetical protein